MKLKVIALFLVISGVFSEVASDELKEEQIVMNAENQQT
jgi:hypothetical protein